MSESLTASSRKGRAPGPAIQLHTLETLDEPLPETVERVAAAGFKGVEFAHEFLNADPDAVRAVLTDTGTDAVAAHVALSRLERDAASVVDRCLAVDCHRVVVPHVGAGHFRTVAAVDGLAARLAGLQNRLERDGIDLVYHNSRETFLPPVDQFGLRRLARVPLPGNGWQVVAEALAAHEGFDVTDVPDRTGFGRLLDRTPDRIGVELDVGWCAAAGYDPVDVMDLLGDRLSLVHVANVRRTRRVPPTYRSAPPDEGILDLHAVVSAAAETPADWLVFEHDGATDHDRAVARGLLAVTA